MELVLEGTERAPAGAVLSLKIGETRRQAPLSKLGQPFKFTSSPSSALPMKVEVLVPAAPAQNKTLDPMQDAFVVDMGKGLKIQMSKRAVQELQKPVPDVGKVAEARGLAGEKKAMASAASKYLEKHDLVRLLQEMLHGLIVSTPEDPWEYLEKHIGNAKKLAMSKPVKREESQPGLEKRPSRGSITCHSKVEALIDILQRARDNLPLILPYLPDDMSDMLVSEDLAKECQRQFSELDKRKKGALSPDCLLPVLVQLSTANHHSVTKEQAQKFLSLFDVNEDGEISLAEFTSLTQFVIIAAHLESEEGCKTVMHAQNEEAQFSEFINMLLKDKDRINDVVPFLPDWLTGHLTSEKFIEDCMEQFDILDADKSNSLEPEEMIPVVLQLSKVSEESIDMAKCKQFVAAFDVLGNGVLVRDEFVEFSQFLSVLLFLASSAEGRQVEEAAIHAAEMRKCDELISMLENDVSKLPQVMAHLPPTMLDEMWSDGFATECVEGFKKLDTNRNGKLEPKELFPLIKQLAEGHPVDINDETCDAFTAVFDKDKNGIICIGEFATLCKFIITMGYLHFAKDWRDLTVSHSRDKIERLLKLMQEHCDRLDEVLPLLPDAMQDELMSDAFAKDCMQYFDQLDKDGSGSLEPNELVHCIIDLCQAHPFALTEKQCYKFIEIFDSEKTGVISRNEFLNCARFLMIMWYLESEDGQAVQAYADIAKGETQVKELLHMLETDRNAVHKILPLLPEDVYADLCGDEFVVACHKRFEELDVDSSGALEPQELFPLIVDLSDAHPYAIDIEHCEQFTKIFDVYGDGVIRIDEFVDFARFLSIMSYLNSEQGQHECAELLQILSDSKQIDELIEIVSRDRHDVRLVLPFLPDEYEDYLLSEEFTLSCLERFHDLDKDGNGTLDPQELYPIILEMTESHHMSLDMDQCVRFTAIFDDGKTGVINEKEFVNFARFLVVMGFLQSEPGQKTLELAAFHHDISKGEAKVNEYLEMLKSSRNALPKILPLLPDDIFDLLTSDEFVQDCQEKFKALDDDKSGVLEPRELYPVIVELSQAHPYSISVEQCEEFTRVFDSSADGVIQIDEFVDFVRFLTIISYMQSELGSRDCAEALQIMEDSRQIDELIRSLEKDRSQIKSVLPYLPEEYQTELLSEQFTRDCLNYFKELDADGNGTLDAAELYPIIIDMTSAHSLALDIEQCKKFTAIFDDDGNAVISQKEFVNFARFLMVMTFLTSEEGQRTLAMAESHSKQDTIQNQSATALVRGKVNVDTEAPSSRSTAKSPSGKSPSSPKAHVDHLTVELDHHQRKAEKLAKENDEQRRTLLRMEEKIRQMEDRMELQETQLKHAQVDLSTSR